MWFLGREFSSSLKPLGGFLFTIGDYGMLNSLGAELGDYGMLMENLGQWVDKNLGVK